MLKYLSDFEGALTINGKPYSSIQEAMKDLRDYTGSVVITVGQDKEPVQPLKTSPAGIIIDTSQGDPVYQIKIRAYLLKEPSIDFDFHTKWNQGIPVPMRIMVGRKLKETQGLVQMELWGEITEPISTSCMKCGRTLTNEVSKYFGIGPECGGHRHINPFHNDEELHQAVAVMQQELRKVRWTGWIIKSAIEEEKLLYYIPKVAE